MANQHSTIHGHARRLKPSPTYRSWQNMIDRCYRNTNIMFYRYGGRGIKVCRRWKNFKNFLKDMGEKPFNLSLDRIDNDKNYTPENCRWATIKQQSRNKRNTVRLTINGETKSVYDWSEQFGIPAKAVILRMSRGWKFEDLFLPTSPRKVRRPLNKNRGHLSPNLSPP